MARTVIEEAWAHYRKAVIPANAPQVQIVETRRAFYAGAHALFTALVGGMTADADPTEEDMQLMQDVDAELTAFLHGMAKGKN